MLHQVKENDTKNFRLLLNNYLKVLNLKQKQTVSIEFYIQWGILKNLATKGLLWWSRG